MHILRSMPGSAIIYARNRRRTKEITELLNNEHITADFYHAGLDDATKDIRQHRWQSGESRVMVATNAFGMGIDKPDVRIVIHMDLPDSIEAYFQEAGRAGRDGQKAYAVILYAKSDKTTLHKRILDTFPEKEYIRDVYEHLQYYYQMAMGDGLDCVREFNIEDFCRKFKYFPVPVDSALRILTQAAIWSTPPNRTAPHASSSPYAGMNSTGCAKWAKTWTGSYKPCFVPIPEYSQTIPISTKLRLPYAQDLPAGKSTKCWFTLPNCAS